MPTCGLCQASMPAEQMEDHFEEHVRRVLVEFPVLTSDPGTLKRELAKVVCHFREYLGKPKALRLAPQPVPWPLDGISAQRLVKPRAIWKRIAAAALAEAGHRCSICGAEPQPGRGRASRLECHENWHYDDRQQVATLTGFQALCRDCHWSAHIGGDRSLGYRKSVVAHYAQVNGIWRAVAEAVYTRAIDRWKKRNRKRWTVTVLEALLAEYPELQILVGRCGRPHVPPDREAE